MARRQQGKQQAELDQVVEDMRRGIISVLVVWQSSRIERRGAWSVFDLAKRVREAGGRIEYVRDQYLNDTNDMSDVLLALAATKDKKESQDKSERVRAAHQRSRENRAFVGAVPWGFSSEGDRYAKHLVPTTEGTTIVPEVSRRCIDGESLVTIASWLTTAAPGRRWNSESVRIMIRNPVYRGTQVNADGRVIYRCPPIVDAAMWKRANDALTNREKRGTSRTDGRALLAGVFTCADCGHRCTGAARRASSTGAMARCPTGRAAA